jgi:DNA-binding transcriptional MocR family regulator
VPGYDRHFRICQEFGIEMINIPMTPEGLDMELVRQYAESDPSVKGIWCVPKYSNPQGYTYSADTVRAFAALKPAADDFRIFWDNAYIVHGFREQDDELLNIFDACKEYGSEDMVYEYMSTSKVTFSGAGVAVLAASANNVKFLCPSPGYDRHFAVTERYGIKNVPVRMLADGPDMDEVERLVESDASVKGIWCVPKYANPTGITYSDEVVCRFANLKPAAKDFRIFWDNAYIVHDVTEPKDELLNIFDVLAHTGNPDLVFEFASTAKVTFPSSGMAFVASSDANIKELKAAFAIERVSPEKLTQLMHIRFLKDKQGVLDHMAKQAKILRPRFELVQQKLADGLGDLGIASWTSPHGGYFVSFDGPRGSAKAIVGLMKELGVTMTGAGATWPYGKDPLDSNIRIAPTYPSLEELSSALDVFVLVVKLVAARLERQAR